MKKSQRRVLALDPATVCGWAIFEDRKIDTARFGMRCAGRMDFGNLKGDHPGDLWKNIGHWIRQICRSREITHIVIERSTVACRSGAAQRIAWGFQILSQLVAARMDLKWVSVPPTRVKLHATGKGNATKQMMIDAARKRWHMVRISDDNVADALWIGDWFINGQSETDEEEDQDNP